MRILLVIMASIKSTDEGIVKVNNMETLKQLSNFAIKIRALVHVESDGGGPGILTKITRLPNSTQK